MGNHVSEINQNKGRDTWFKDAFSVAKEANFVLCKQESPHADFDLDRALVNYNVIDGDVLLLKEV